MHIDTLNVARLAATALQTCGLALAIGSLLCGRWLSGIGGLSDWRDGLAGALRSTLRAGVALILIAALPIAWLAAATMSGSTLGEAGASLQPMVEQTHYGHLWLAGTTIAVLSLGAAARAVRVDGGVAWGLLWLGLVAFALTRSASGHAADAAEPVLPILMDWIHLLAISTWVGVTLVTAMVVAPRMPPFTWPDRRLCAAFILALSNTAMAALATLVVTGLFSAWRLVRTVQHLLYTDYGHTLLVKAALVIACIGLGGFNRFAEMPKLRAALDGPVRESGKITGRRFMRVLSFEAILLLGALLAATLLAGSAPPGPM